MWRDSSVIPGGQQDRISTQSMLPLVLGLGEDRTTTMHLKACSDDPFLRIRFLVPKTGSRCSDGPISRFRFCGENVRRSFAVCSHDPFFRANKESSMWLQNDHAKFVGAFHLSRRVLDENRAYSISIRFFSKLGIRLIEGHF